MAEAIKYKMITWHEDERSSKDFLMDSDDKPDVFYKWN